MEKDAECCVLFFFRARPYSWRLHILAPVFEFAWATMPILPLLRLSASESTRKAGFTRHCTTRVARRRLRIERNMESSSPLPQTNCENASGDATPWLIMREVTLGLRANARQFWLLVLINAFVGAMVGLKRELLPLLGEKEFRVAWYSVRDHDRSRPDFLVWRWCGAADAAATRKE